MNIEKLLINKGITGDELLNVLDIVELIKEVNGTIDNQGNVILYHATNYDRAMKIVAEQKMFGKEDGLFFSTKPNGQIAGYGQTILKVRIPIELLHLDDDFGDELHLRIPVIPNQKISVDVSLL